MRYRYKIKKSIIGLRNMGNGGRAVSMHHHGNIMEELAITAEKTGLNLANQGRTPHMTGEFFVIAHEALRYGRFCRVEEKKHSSSRPDRGSAARQHPRHH